MKQNLFRIIQFSLVLLMCFSSCQKEKVFLTGTEWKLVEFVDVATGEMKKAEPTDKWCYRLTLHKNRKMSGYSSTNSLEGKYKINYTQNYIKITIELMTLVNEYDDGDFYLESLENVNFFSVQENELKLYYNNKQNYLLFKKQEL